ncbi:MAG: hypothetical protein ACYTAN_01925 [Planctomycetota bacterium]
MAEKAPKTMTVEIVRNCVVQGERVVVYDRKEKKRKPRRMTLPTPVARELLGIKKARPIKGAEQNGRNA